MSLKVENVSRTRIGVMGWNTGDSIVMLVVDETGVQQHFEPGFAAGVAFYPIYGLWANRGRRS